LSVVDDSVAWLGGTAGTIGRSTNGGITWTFTQVPGHTDVDFRTLYAFDKQKAVIANAGSPAHILLTTDGGASWREVYTNKDSSAFFDGVDFWNDNEGIIFGDPIRGRMLMLRTRDGGMNWGEITTSPKLKEGEASFAASGTGIRCLNKKDVILATGGKTSRLFLSLDKGQSWRSILTPILQGESTTGTFSIAFRNFKEGIIVGGDYKRDTLKVAHVFYTLDGGRIWKTPASPTRGYRECVEFVDAKRVISTGPTGTDISNNNGISWEPLSDDKGFHVVRKARKGTRIIAAGSKGAIAVLR
jgi:photosystem II stability/assembly factor-like uncharacterized protein